MSRLGFIGRDPLGGIGASDNYWYNHREYHTASTRFVIFHRIPSGSTLAAVDGDDMSIDPWPHIDMQSLESTVTLEPEVRKVVS